jgi:hypothetical protein
MTIADHGRLQTTPVWGVAGHAEGENRAGGRERPGAADSKEQRNKTRWYLGAERMHFHAAEARVGRHASLVGR